MDLHEFNGFRTRFACVLGFVAPVFLAGWVSGTNKQLQFAPLAGQREASVGGTSTVRPSIHQASMSYNSFSSYNYTGHRYSSLLQ
jgi:hypothetical protein